MKNCLNCTKLFTPEHSAQRYCSEKCRYENAIRKRRATGPKKWKREVDLNPNDKSDHIVLRQIYPEFYNVARPQEIKYKKRKCLRCGKVRSIQVPNRICLKCNRFNATVRSFI